MTTDIRAALEQWRDLAETDLLCPANPAETDWSAVVVAIAATRAALAAEPVGEGPSAADLLPANPPNISTTMAMQYRSAWREGVEDGWNEARAILARWAHPAAPAAPLSDLANRLISGSRPMDPEMALTPEERWNLYEPAAPPAPEPGEVGELVDRLGWIAAQLGDIGWSDDSASVARAATLLSQQAAPTPVPVAGEVAEDLQHLIRFMCRTWVAIDEWASMFSEAMDTYPMIQGTRNQMNLREIAAQSYDKKRVALGVQLMLPAHAIPLPQAGEVES